MKVESTILNIGGMTCSACVRNVEQTVKGQAGVDDASVNFATEKLQVNYHPEQVSLQDLIDAVKKKGYEASLPVEEISKTFLVAGMTCAACVKRVEDAILGIAGVRTAAVNLATEKARVTYLPGDVTESDIIHAVGKAGYALSRADDSDTRELADLFG